MSEGPLPAVVAHPTGAPGLDLPTPQTNAALQLAGSLAGVNDALTPALGQIGKVLQERQSAKAQADALANSGQAFSDAVKAGKLKPTQNPWYLAAYAEKSAAIRSQGQLSGLVAQSQTWAEKTNPQAFAQRWAHEVGQIAQGYAGDRFAMRGFQSSADPISQQALNSNLEFNAQRINVENVQNTTQLMSSAIEDLYKKNPKAAPQDFYAALDPLLTQWHNTGGTDAQANELVKGAFEAAAANSGDGDILDNLKYDRGGGKGSIYNMVGANGDPNADQIESTRYRIIRLQEAAGMGAIRKLQNEAELEGAQFSRLAYAHYGYDLVGGKISSDDLAAFAKANGVSAQGFQAFMKDEARDLSANDEYARAQTQAYAKDPANQSTILSLRTEALRSGWSQTLEDKVWSQVRAGMDEATANDILTKADNTSKYNRSEAKADAREARSQANFDRSMKAQASRDFKAYVGQTVGTLDQTLQAAGDRSVANNSAYRTQITRQITDAGNAWLRQHPDDYDGADVAMDSALAAELARKRRLRGGQPQGTTMGGNPRGGQ